jgi:hypothetical protein
MVLSPLPAREIDYDGDDYTVPARLPLLPNSYAQHGPNYLEPNLPCRSDSCIV